MAYREFDNAIMQAEIFDIVKRPCISSKTWWCNLEAFALAWRIDDDAMIWYYNNKMNQKAII